MQERTEQQVYSRTAKLRLGGREYVVKVLPIKPAEQWLSRFWEFFRGLGDVQLAAAMGDIEAIHHVYDLVFEYAPELEAQRDEILESADPDELFTAFDTIYRLANPLARLARTVLGVGEIVSPTGTR